jgi:hypothetical protein
VLLQSIRTGVLDVLPEGSLDSLTAEDLRLLLNGVGDINVAVLISYTSFNDESGENSERLVKFKRWLWSIVEKMTHLERQDLVRRGRCVIQRCTDPVAGVLLDGLTGPTGQRRRLPTDAFGDHQAGGRRTFTDGQHMYITFIYSTLQ